MAVLRTICFKLFLPGYSKVTISLLFTGYEYQNNAIMIQSVINKRLSGNKLRTTLWIWAIRLHTFSSVQSNGLFLIYCVVQCLPVIKSNIYLAQHNARESRVFAGNNCCWFFFYEIMRTPFEIWKSTCVVIPRGNQSLFDRNWF